MVDAIQELTYKLQETKDVSNHIRNTIKFLNHVSTHVSSRSNYHHAEFKVVITEDSISIFPEIFVYKNRFLRKDCNRNRLEDHIVIEHMKFLYCRIDIGGNLLIKSNYLVPGVYQYTLSATKKSRKWMKL